MFIVLKHGILNFVHLQVLILILANEKLPSTQQAEMCDVQLNKSDACSTKFNQSWRVV
jgi:hypothetical protein